MASRGHGRWRGPSPPQRGPKRFAAAHCDLATRLAPRLGISERVVAALGQIYERWDGRGQPNGISGEAIALPARLMHVAWRAEVHRALQRPTAAVEVVPACAGGELEPRLAAGFAESAHDLLDGVAAPSVWELFLAAEPEPFAVVAPDRVDEVAEAFAHFVDVKSPFTLGHSTGVARLAAAAAKTMGLSSHELRVAALLHDLGRVSVPNGIWDKPGPFNPAERERLRRHAYETERIS